MTLEEAYTKCTALAESHYENFPVGKLVPAEIRPHVHAVYAFARVADDFADEGYVQERPDQPVLTPEQRTAHLQHFEDQLTRALKNQPLDPEYAWIFLPIADTVEEFQIPHQLFYDLLSAFKQDVVKNRYATFDEVLDYCRRSANPIGRLVLHLHGHHQEIEHTLSDFICTALQLANFWQDVSVDLKKNRIYIPIQDQHSFGFDEASLFEGNASDGFIRCMEFQVHRTWTLFQQGRPLARRLSFPLSWEIRFTWLGGTTILKKIEHLKYNTLHTRPKLTKRDMLRLGACALISR